MDEWQCRRKYYLHQIVGIERKSLSIPFTVGKIVETGVSALLKKDKGFIDKAYIHYKEIQKDAKRLILTEKEKEELEEIGTYLRGMLESFKNKYIGFIRKIKRSKDGIKLRLELDYGIIVGEIDNMFIWEDDKLWMEELKTAKELTLYRIEKVQHDLQHGLYYYTFHKIYSKLKIYKILYHIIRKPSIRQKKAEQLHEYQGRLMNWYKDLDSPGDDRRFWDDQLDKPKLREVDVFNTVNHKAKEIFDAYGSSNPIDAFYQNFDMCSDKYGKCQFFQICHRGEGISVREIIRLYYRKSNEVMAYWSSYGVQQPKSIIQIDKL